MLTNTSLLRPTCFIGEPPFDYPDREGKVCLDVYWEGVPLDRPSTNGFLFRLERKPIMMRLKQAIEDGKVYVNPHVLKDKNGDTYVEADCLVYFRTLDADLKKLGY